MRMFFVNVEYIKESLREGFFFVYVGCIVKCRSSLKTLFLLLKKDSDYN